MRRSVLLLMPAIALTLAAGPACSRQAPPPPPPPAPVMPITGWTTQNGQAMARVLMDAATSHAWVAAFRQSANRMPVVEVGELEDRTGDHLPVDEIQSELERTLAASDRVLAAAQGQVADASLSGAIRLIQAGAGKQLYQVDLRIRDKAGEALWFNGMEVERSEPVPVAPPAPAPGKG
jgi:hypothetical protein